MDFGTIIDAAFSAAFGPQAIVFALAAIGLNIHFGYTGLLNFGQAGFMAIAYGYFRMTAGRRADLATPGLLRAQH